MSRPLTMAETAAEVGLSYERFRKVWPDIPGFPAPLLSRKWDPEAVAAWKAARSRPVELRERPRPSAPAASRARAQLQLLRAS
jgi:hypothetical protein